MKAQKIIFQDDELLLIDGLICTEDQIKNGYSVYAVFDEDDKNVWRHNEIIGSKDDIKFLGEIEIEMSLEDWLTVFVNMVEGTGWPIDK